MSKAVGASYGFFQLPIGRHLYNDLYIERRVFDDSITDRSAII